MRPYDRSALATVVGFALVAAVGGGWWLTYQIHLADQVQMKARALTGGDPQAGRRAIAGYGCGACHTIPGVAQATAKVGPPLAGVGARAIIGGELSNTPTNMVQWIRAPRSIDPHTAMPNMGVTDKDARDIAAYLYTLD